MVEFLEGVLQEGMDQLARTKISLQHGGYSLGSATAVRVTVRPETAEPGSYRIQVQCHAAGHLNVHWDGIPVILVAGETHDERIGFLDRQGRVEFVAALPAETRVSLEPLARPVFEMEFPMEFVTALCSPEGASQPEPIKGRSPDGALVARAELAGRGLLDLSVRALKPDLYHSAVEVVLRSKRTPSKVIFRKQIKLDIAGGSKGAWQEQVGSGELEAFTADAVLLVSPARRGGRLK
jgi:hypothetical protein